MNATPDNTLRSSWWRPASLFEALAGTVWLGFALAASITLLWYSAFPAGVAAVGRALVTEACFAAMLWALMQCVAVLQTGRWRVRRRGARARRVPPMLALPSREAAPHPAWRLFSSAPRAMPQHEEMIDALRMIFSRPYEELYAEAANPASGSSVEDLHAMAAEYIMRLKAATAERIVGRTPAPIVMPTRLPRTGEYFDFVKRRPRFLGK
ncbi:MAG: hypothetical protein C0497_05975 [Gemmatimonas sp.]|nr:hypothetical protein [Gemmatimonas sp.]